tara:strand:+ start:1896 stop:2147 length:252 start_codon:yes stop_codon:yes gene_type:complete
MTEPEDYEMTEQDWDDMEEVERRKRLGALHTIRDQSRRMLLTSYVALLMCETKGEVTNDLIPRFLQEDIEMLSEGIKAWRSEQ